MFKILTILAVVPAVIFAASPHHPCAGGLPRPDAVFFGGRENPCRTEPCAVFRSVGSGTTYIDFTVNRQITGLRPELRARVLGLLVTHDLPPEMMSQPWNFLIGNNPLQAGNRATFNLTVPVEPNTPLVQSVNIFTLFDQSNQPIFCYEIASVVRN